MNSQPSPFPDFFRRPPGWAGLMARLALGGVLAAAGTLKAAAPAEEFALVLEAYPIIPQQMTLTLAAFLPWIELLVGFSLMAGYLTRQAALAAAALLLSFIAALVSAKVRGIALPHCGCFGAGFHPSPDATLLMDSGLALFAYLSYKAGASLASLDNWANGPNPRGDLSHRVLGPRADRD